MFLRQFTGFKVWLFHIEPWQMCHFCATSCPQSQTQLKVKVSENQKSLLFTRVKVERYYFSLKSKLRIISKKKNMVSVAVFGTPCNYNYL